VRPSTPLNQTNGADATGSEGGVGPLFEVGPTRSHWPTSRSTNACCRVEASVLPAAQTPQRRPGHAPHERVHVEDAHQLRIPLHAEPLAEEGERHRIERPTHFDMPVGVNRPLAGREERKGGAGEGPQRLLLDLNEVRPDLAASRAVNAQAGDRAIPVPQKRILRVEAVKRASLERVAFHVATAALLLPVFLRCARLRRQRREAPSAARRAVKLEIGSSGWIRTSNPPVNRRRKKR
jgi:hypothetical protein